MHVLFCSAVSALPRAGTLLLTHLGSIFPCLQQFDQQKAGKKCEGLDICKQRN
jgi:hypothetical protein